MNKNEINKQWHQGFYSAARLELNEDREGLEFEEEYYLSHEPLRIDLLAIKKDKELKIKNEIGHIFRKYNLFEYKSPEDGLTIDDYYKTIGYACLYKSLADKVDEITEDEISITLVREGYPSKLIKRLKESGCDVSEYVPGIYYVKGNTLFPMQIVVTGKLGEEHTWLKVLTKKLKEKDFMNFTSATEYMLEQGQKNYIDAIYQISVMANMEKYDEFKRRWPEMCEALKILMKPEIDAAVGAAKNEGMQQGLQQGIQQGIQSIIAIITRLRKGENVAALLAEGFSDEAIKMAVKALE